MLVAEASEEVPLSADAVWKVIGDFWGIRKWAPAIMDERMEESPEGKLRVLSMPPDGREVRELLSAQDSYSYTYKYIGETKFARNYHGTVSVVPIDARNSRIVLRSEFDAVAGLEDEEALANMGKGARGNLKAMKRALGLA